MPDYDFRQLSPHDFEILCRDLLQAEWGLLLESFKAGPDRGIDLRYARAGQDIIVQCKRYVETSIAGLLRELRSEASKVRRLAPKRYVLVTAAPLSARNKDAIIEILGPDRLQPSDVLGREDLNNLLARHPAVEQSHYKLWLASRAVLDRALHNAVLVHSEIAVDEIHRQVQRYVQGDAYPLALTALEDQHTVILSGLPGVGKSTLARMLLYRYLGEGYEPIVIREDFSEALQVFHRDKKQIFYFDDFLGVTFLGDRKTFLSRNEDRTILEFMSAVRNAPHARLVMTTREHILNQAIQISERLRGDGIVDRKVVVEMGSYSFRQRGQILYNHIFFSDLPHEYRQVLLDDEFYLEIVEHEKFNPRLIEWLSTFQRIRSVTSQGYRSFIEAMLADPSEVWRHAYERQLDHAARSVMLTLFSLGGRAEREELAEAFSFLHDFRSQAYRFERAPGDFKSALSALSGSFIRFVRDEVQVLDPSVKDMLNMVIRDAPENVVDLILGACKFNQVERAWNAFTAVCKRADLHHFRRHAPALTASIGRLALVDRRSQHPAGATVYSGRSFEARLQAVAGMANTIRVAPFDELTHLVAKRLEQEWQNEWPQLFDCIELLRAEFDWPPIQTLAALRPRCIAALVKDVQGGCSSIELVALLSLIDFSGDEGAYHERVLRGAAEGFFEHYFRDDLNTCEDPEDYDALADRVARLGFEFSIDVSERLKFLAELAGHYEAENARDADTQSASSDEAEAEVEHNEEELRDLFETLRPGKVKSRKDRG